MFTAYDKAFAALLGSILTLVAAWGIDVAALEPLIGPVGAVLTAAFTYLIPNKDTVENPDA